jgi:CheY-like chemotaxis protein
LTGRVEALYAPLQGVPRGHDIRSGMGGEMGERRRILIVEDDCLIATWVAEVFEASGWQVIGPVGHLATALDTATRADFDAAVLDITLRGQAVYPVAEVLDARKVPFAFLTGYLGAFVEPRYSERPRVGKPFTPGELIGTVARLIAPPTASATG